MAAADQDKETGLTYFGARYYDSRRARWVSPDPAIEERAGDLRFFLTPSNEAAYLYGHANPVTKLDPDGREPVVAQAGTIEEFREALNRSPSGVGQLKGADAAVRLTKFGRTEWSWKVWKGPNPSDNWANKQRSRYVYTKKRGWIDMSHFLFYAGKAFAEKASGSQNPVGDAVQAGFQQEATDTLRGARHSVYSYEDLPSDKAGAQFGAQFFDANSERSLGEHLEEFMKSLGASTPKEAPNFDTLPGGDSAVRRAGRPTQTNKTTIPLHVRED